jgi:hypothetical protein
MKYALYQLLTLFFITHYTTAQQGNYKFSNYGNRSILLSGNVTGSVEDLGLTYYNPARLTEVENTAFAINAKAYELNSLKLTNVVGNQSKLTNNQFGGKPTMAGGTFKLFGDKFAYSFLSKTRTDINLNYSSNLIPQDILDAFPDEENYAVGINLDTKVKDEWIGLTWATKMTEKLSLGISLFGSIYQFNGSSNLNYAVQSLDSRIAYYQNTIGFKQNSYGLIFKIGANYRLENIDIGLNINMPYLELYEKGAFRYKKIIAGDSSDSDLFLDSNLDNLQSQRKEPFGISLGSGISLGRSKLHLNIDYVSGISNYSKINVPNINTGELENTPVEFEEERKDVINFGAGIEFYMTEKLSSYFSFSTDFNGFSKNANVFDLTSDSENDINVAEDFIHFGLGIDMKMSWASLVLGTTYANSGTSEFSRPLNPEADELNITDNEVAQFEFSRWQFIIGIEIPFLDKKLKTIQSQEK